MSDQQSVINIIPTLTIKVWSFAKHKLFKKSIESNKAKKGNKDCILLFGKTPKQFGYAELPLTINLITGNNKSNLLPKGAACEPYNR